MHVYWVLIGSLRQSRRGEYVLFLKIRKRCVMNRRTRKNIINITRLRLNNWLQNKRLNICYYFFEMLMLVNCNCSCRISTMFKIFDTVRLIKVGIRSIIITLKNIFFFFFQIKFFLLRELWIEIYVLRRNKLVVLNIIPLKLLFDVQFPIKTKQ